MLGQVKAVQKDKKAVFIVFDRPARFKMNQVVNVSDRKQVRTLKQNAMYWAFLSWCISPFGGDLQSLGHFSVDALHENIKEWLMATHKRDFNIDGKFTTTELDKKQFAEFFNLVNQELMVDILEIDTSGFWVEYERFKEWAQYNEPDFRTFMDGQHGGRFLAGPSSINAGSGGERRPTFG